MGTKGIAAIAGAVVLVAAFPTTSLLMKIGCGIVGAASGAVIGETFETEIVNVKKQIEELRTFREWMATQRATMQAAAAKA